MKLDITRALSFALRRAVSTLGSIALATLALVSGLMVAAFVQLPPPVPKLPPQGETVVLAPGQASAIGINGEILP